MKRNVIVHIGHGKTGSSAIQSFLAGNRDLLMEFGIDYPPHTSRASTQNAIAGKITSGNGLTFYDFELTLQTTLFSSEVLFVHLVNEQRLIEKLTNDDYTVRIICFTRDLFDHFISSWGQSIKRGGANYDISAHAARYRQYPVLLDVLNLLENLEIPVSLMNYSRHEDDIVAKFLHMILGERADAFMQRAFRLYVPVNRSLTRAENELQRQFNKYLGRSSSAIHSDPLVNELPHLQAETPILEPACIDQVLEHNLDAVTHINQRLPAEEKILTGPPSLAPGKSEASDCFCFTQEQLEVLARSIGEHIKKQQQENEKARGSA